MVTDPATHAAMPLATLGALLAAWLLVVHRWRALGLVFVVIAWPLSYVRARWARRLSARLCGWYAGVLEEEIDGE